jgi:DNA-binding transcriptional MocR family regulator
VASAKAGFEARGVLRRALGSTAWVAFEVLVERSATEAGERVAVASVRTVAAELGVAKNTAARALAVLRAAGVVTVAQARDGAGHFAQASYLIHTARGASHPSTIDTAVTQRTVPDPRPRSTPRRRRADTGQLTLLDQA